MSSLKFSKHKRFSVCLMVWVSIVFYISLICSLYKEMFLKFNFRCDIQLVTDLVTMLKMLVRCLLFFVNNWTYLHERVKFLKITQMLCTEKVWVLTKGKVFKQMLCHTFFLLDYTQIYSTSILLCDSESLPFRVVSIRCSYVKVSKEITISQLMR